MPTNNLNGYLDSISQITNFNQNFGTSLNNILSAIDRNFQKLVALPLLQGDNGDNIIRVEEAIYDSTHKFTAFGQAVLRAIFDFPNTITIEGLDYNGLVSALLNYPTSTDYNIEWDKLSYNTQTTPSVVASQYSFENFNYNIASPIKKIDCYQVENTNDKKVFVSLFHFVDPRISNLQYRTSTYDITNYRDRSCTLYGIATYTNNVWTWDIRRYETIPTIYYSSTQGCFCWKINGQYTDISAQGVKGDKGDRNRIWICKGRKYVGVSITPTENKQKVWVTAIDYLNTDTTSTTHNVSEIQYGDILYIWFSKDDSSTTIPSNVWDDSPYETSELIESFTIGVAVPRTGSGTNDKYVYYNPDVDIFDIIFNFGLRGMLEAVGYNSTASTGLRGLVVPGNGLHYASQNEHFIYSSNVANTDELHITNTTRANTLPNTFADTTTLDYSANSSSLNVDYSNIKSLPWRVGAIKGNYEMGFTEQNITKKELSSGPSGSPGQHGDNSNTIRATVPNEKSTSVMNEPNPELAINLQSKKTLFFGGRNLGNDGFGGASRNVVDGSGNTLTNDVLSYQHVQKNKDAEVTLGEEDCEVSSIFNFVPPTGNETSYFNMRYVKNIVLSDTHTQQFALCHNPNAKIIIEDDRMFLRLYLPSLQYLRDFKGAFGNGTNPPHGTKLNEVLLYDKVRYVCNENLSAQDSFRTVATSSLATSSGKSGNALKEIAGYMTYITNSINTTEASPIRCTKGNDYFDVLIGDGESIDTVLSNGHSLLITTAGLDSGTTPYNSYDSFNGYKITNGSYVVENHILLKAKLEKEIAFGECTANENLFLKYIAIKRVSNSSNSFQVVYIYAPMCQTYKFNSTNPQYQGYESSIFLNIPNINLDDTIMYSGHNSAPDAIRQAYDTNIQIYGEHSKFSTMKHKYNGSSSTADWSWFSSNNIINYCTCVSSIVTFDSASAPTRIVSVAPATQSNCPQYVYNLGTGVWRFSRGTTGGPTSFEMFGWREVWNMTDAVQYNTNTNKLFIPSPTTNWVVNKTASTTEDISSYSTKNVTYDYDSYEIQIGQTLLSSRPRHESMPYTITEDFRPLGMSYDCSSVILRETHRVEPHDFMSYLYTNRNNDGIVNAVYYNNRTDVPIHSDNTAYSYQNSTFMNLLTSVQLMNLGLQQVNHQYQEYQQQVPTVINHLQPVS